MKKIFDGVKTTKIGTEKKPAVVNVQTKKRMKEVAAISEKHGWKYTLELEPDKMGQSISWFAGFGIVIACFGADPDYIVVGCLTQDLITANVEDVIP